MLCILGTAWGGNAEALARAFQGASVYAVDPLLTDYAPEGAVIAKAVHAFTAKVSGLGMATTVCVCLTPSWP